MILTSKKPQEEVLASLQDSGTIFVIGCASCAARSKTGDQKAVDDMKELLLSKGKQVAGTLVLPAACNLQTVEKYLAKNEDFAKADAVLILACGTGVQTVGDIFPQKTIAAGLNSICISTSGSQNKRFCSVCGHCVLSFTQGLCQKTRCPKGLVNGPCGGFVGGKCEVDDKQDCVWVLIYEKLKKHGKADEFIKSFISPL
ncbi:MAG: methylenetetrahydrofolate reductase C-terminal domain-containing protein [Elusimicrobiota bacterium]|jgi:hypothetical protein|nr:methylenetetrahydrofolate reductase C-terminal domain-containing protein [Elusimicrobiota bacterium]